MGDQESPNEAATEHYCTHCEIHLKNFGTAIKKEKKMFCPNYENTGKNFADMARFVIVTILR